MNDGIRAAAAILDTMTTPESEDWLVIVNGDKCWLTALRETADGGGQPYVEARSGEVALDEIKKVVRGLTQSRNLGVVQIILPTDAAKCGGEAFFKWMLRKAKQKDFSLTTILGQVDTAAAIQTSRLLAMTSTYGTA